MKDVGKHICCPLGNSLPPEESEAGAVVPGEMPNWGWGWLLPQAKRVRICVASRISSVWDLAEMSLEMRKAHAEG